MKHGLVNITIFFLFRTESKNHLDFENVAPMKTTIVLLRKVDRIASQAVVVVVVVVVKVELDVDDLSLS